MGSTSAARIAGAMGWMDTIDSAGTAGWLGAAGIAVAGGCAGAGLAGALEQAIIAPATKLNASVATILGVMSISPLL
tara:strand:+ start:8941 stop:9171 length:231 start_codon:yes stop_codon:yes gene_type:complete